jgi:hypothetical protein
LKCNGAPHDSETLLVGFSLIFDAFFQLKAINPFSGEEVPVIGKRTHGAFKFKS